MPRYLVTLDFRFAFAKCDPTPGQKPPGLPEEIAELTPDLLLQCIKEEEGVRTHHAELVYEADTADGLREALCNTFNHLVGFEVINQGVAPVKYPEATTDKPVDDRAHLYDNPVDGKMCQCNVRCHFRSGLPMDVLATGFAKHVANGHLSPNGTVQLEYVAWVTIETANVSDIDNGVERLLAKAFDAETEESAVNFQPITTTLL